MSVLRPRAAALEPVLDWTARLAGVNLLWLGGTLAGGVVLGLFPTTVALVSTVHDWLADPTTRDRPTTRRFAAVAWRERYRANLLGWPLAAVATLLVLDVQFSAALPGTTGQVLAVAAASALLLVAITALQLPVVVVRHDLRGLAAVRYAAVSGLAHPVRSLGLLALAVGWSYVLGRWPGLLPFFGLSPLVACLVAGNLRRRSTSPRPFLSTTESR